MPNVPHFVPGDSCITFNNSWRSSSIRSILASTSKNSWTVGSDPFKISMIRIMSQKKTPQKKSRTKKITLPWLQTHRPLWLLFDQPPPPPSQSFPVARWRCPRDTWASVRQPFSVLNEACRKDANIPPSHKKEQLAGIHLNPGMVENPGWTFLQPLFEDTWLEFFWGNFIKWC